MVVFNRPIQKLFIIRTMRGKLITGLESRRDAEPGGNGLPRITIPGSKKPLDVAFIMFENIRQIFGRQRKSFSRLKIVWARQEGEWLCQ